MNFRENFKKDMKKCDHHIADLRKQLASRYASVEKVRGQGTSLVNSWGCLEDRNQMLVSQQKPLSLCAGVVGQSQGTPTYPCGRQELLPQDTWMTLPRASGSKEKLRVKWEL